MTTLCGNCNKDYEATTQSAHCPHGPKDPETPCVICGEATPYACADCRINLSAVVSVCYKDHCHAQHEKTHPGKHCDICGYRHNDPKLMNFDDVSITIVGNTTLCPVYSCWIIEALTTGHDVTILFLEAKHTLVIKGQQKGTT